MINEALTLNGVINFSKMLRTCYHTMDVLSYNGRVIIQWLLSKKNLKKVFILSVPIAGEERKIT